jgi:restriction system protein
MSVPDFQSFFYPTLLMSKDGKEYSLNDLRDFLTAYFNLTAEEKSERVPSGAQTKFDNRIYWTKSYFSKAKLIDNTKRSHFRITERGINFLNKFQDKITVKDLENFAEFQEFKYGSNAEFDNLTENLQNEYILILKLTTKLHLKNLKIII